jgi:hypothetical protein
MTVGVLLHFDLCENRIRLKSHQAEQAVPAVQAVPLPGLCHSSAMLAHSLHPATSAMVTTETSDAPTPTPVKSDIDAEPEQPHAVNEEV